MAVGGVSIAVVAGGLIGVPVGVVTVAAPAYADCGDPGEPPCSGPVPTDDEVMAIMTELIDPDVPALEKGNIVTPGFSPEDADAVDDGLTRIANSRKNYFPVTLVVADIQPAPADFAGATVAARPRFGLKPVHPTPVVFVLQDGHWLITNDAAMVFLHKLWRCFKFIPPMG